MSTLTNPEFTAKEQLEATRTVIDQQPDVALIKVLAIQLRSAIIQNPLLGMAMALVSAEILAEDEEKND